jgi:hypothetical protein
MTGWDRWYEPSTVSLTGAMIRAEAQARAPKEARPLPPAADFLTHRAVGDKLVRALTQAVVRGARRTAA